MRNTLSTVKNILRRELLVPARKIESRQLLTSDVGLSAFELNALLYFVEEKYQVEIHSIQSDSTVQELVDSINQKINPTTNKK
jgi:acyl carrier protein